ncbi:MAG: hypothetical protein H3C35_12895 [Bacteroidetes bacterium]|nr:hypothetical protein [Bacteroidota bacterium]
MNTLVTSCEHACRNSCATLTKALNIETSLVRMYEEVLRECEEPEVKEFLEELANESSGVVVKIMRKLNEIKARSLVYDAIGSSFNP